MMRRVYPLLLLFAFLLGSLGHMLSRTDGVEEKPYTLTLRAEKANALVLSSLPDAGARITLCDREGTLLSVDAAPARLYAMKDGGITSYSSVLFSAVTLCVAVDAHASEGRFYLGERYLALGDEVTLLSANFSIRAHFIGYSADF